MDASPDLLERLARTAGCAYLSDLRFLRASAPVAAALEGTPAEAYPDRAWRDAAGYDLSLDSEALGEDGCVDRICALLPPLFGEPGCIE